MNRPKDPCKVCPFARQCIAEGEDKRWCLVRILTLEAWYRQTWMVEPRTPAPPVKVYRQDGMSRCDGCSRRPERDRVGYCFDCQRSEL